MNNKKWEKNVFFLERNEIKCDLVRYKVKRWLKKCATTNILCHFDTSYLKTLNPSFLKNSNS